MENVRYTLHIQHSIAELSASSIQLLGHASSPFLDYEWFTAFSEHVSYSLGEPKWLVLCEGNSTVAILPMMARMRGKIRVLQCMSNYYSPYFDLVTAASATNIYLQKIVEKSAGLLSEFDIIEFLPVTESVLRHFVSAFRQKSWSITRYEHTTNWRQTGIADFASYWASRPSKLVSTIQRKRRRLVKMQHEFRIHSTGLSSSALADYHYVYFRSWKKNEPFPAFIDAIARNASIGNRLRLGILYIEDKPVAAQLWIVDKGTAYIMKLAYDPDHSHLSVGSLLSHYMFEQIIDLDRVTTIDYLTGNDAYKAQWMSTQRMLYGLEIANKTTFWGYTSYLKNRVGKLLRRNQQTKSAQ